MIRERLVAAALLAISFAAHGGERCGVAGEADFNGEGRRRLESYLEWLARTSGDPYGIRANEFLLVVSNASPPVIDGHAAEGEIGCSWGKRYISLYKRALTNRDLAATYSTIAYQYFRHVQVRRDGVACDSGTDGRAALDAEARGWALKVASPCR